MAAASSILRDGGDDGEVADAAFQTQPFTFYPAASRNGTPVVRRAPPLRPSRHAYPGGDEDVYDPCKALYGPSFREHMMTNRTDWPSRPLFREGVTIGTVLDQLGMLPENLDALTPLRDAREILVRRWLCLKYVAARTKKAATPHFTKYALGFESLMVQESRIPEAARRSAYTRYEARFAKAQEE
jgi:hypothetical protein